MFHKYDCCITYTKNIKKFVKEDMISFVFFFRKSCASKDHSVLTFGVKSGNEEYEVKP